MNKNMINNKKLNTEGKVSRIIAVMLVAVFAITALIGVNTSSKAGTLDEAGVVGGDYATTGICDTRWKALEIGPTYPSTTDEVLNTINKMYYDVSLNDEDVFNKAFDLLADRVVCWEKQHNHRTITKEQYRTKLINLVKSMEITETHQYYYQNLRNNVLRDTFYAMKGDDNGTFLYYIETDRSKELAAEYNKYNALSAYKEGSVEYQIATAKYDGYKELTVDYDPQGVYVGEKKLDLLCEPGNNRLGITEYRNSKVNTYKYTEFNSPTLPSVSYTDISNDDKTIYYVTLTVNENEKQGFYKMYASNLFNRIKDERAWSNVDDPDYSFLTKEKIKFLVDYYNAKGSLFTDYKRVWTHDGKKKSGQAYTDEKVDMPMTKLSRYVLEVLYNEAVKYGYTLNNITVETPDINDIVCKKSDKKTPYSDYSSDWYDDTDYSNFSHRGYMYTTSKGLCFDAANSWFDKVNLRPEISGYEVEYSYTSKTLKKAKKAEVLAEVAYYTNSPIISNKVLKKKVGTKKVYKKYKKAYIRIRAYKEVGCKYNKNGKLISSKRYYSEWTGVKKINFTNK